MGNRFKPANFKTVLQYVIMQFNASFDAMTNTNTRIRCYCFHPGTYAFSTRGSRGSRFCSRFDIKDLEQKRTENFLEQLFFFLLSAIFYKIAGKLIKNQNISYFPPYLINFQPHCCILLSFWWSEQDSILLQTFSMNTLFFLLETHLSETWS